MTDEDDKITKQKTEDPIYFNERQMDQKQRMLLKEQQVTIQIQETTNESDLARREKKKVSISNETELGGRQGGQL